MLVPLPIDPLLPEVRAAMASGNLVVVAEPGAGKTTRVPPALLGLAGDRRIAVLEPRRIAARAAARRVAEEMGSTVGGAVGYEVRFERQVGRDSRIVYLTEGLLARRLVADPALREVSIAILDEFHERHLQSDLALALLRRAQLGPRPDLRIAVMSATIDPAPVAAFLGDCPIIAAPGRVHPVDLEHSAQPIRDPLEREVARALGRLVQSGLDGHVLAFLPGAGEIRRAMDACADLAARHDLLLVPLHGALPSAEQDRALAPSERRKIVFATNVAETSLTIDGIAAVIDSGLARIARHDPWSGVGALRVEPVSRASCVQRAGRAGRTRPGRCLRLYTRHDLDSRREHEVPEIQRSDLAEAALALRAAGIARGEPFEWFDPPPAPALAAADQLLVRLGAVDRRSGALTPLGCQLEEMPVHPRQARVLVDAEARGAGADGALVAALLGERDVRLARRGRGAAAHTSASDVIDDLDALKSGEDIDRAAASAVRRAADQLGRFTSRRNLGELADLDRALSIALLAGFPDRVARRRRPGAPDLLLCDGAGGGAAVLHPQSAVQEAEILLAIHAEESGRGRDRKVTVRTASAIDPAWLLELYTDDIVDSDQIQFDPRLERVVRIRRLIYDGLVLEETAEQRGIDPAAAGPVLAAAARAAGLATFVDPEALSRLRARADFVARTLPASGIAAISDDELADLIVNAHCTSFAELRAAHLLDQVRPHQRRDLDRLAPDAISLPGRRRVPVHYEPDRPPWIESRLQDFFGLTTGPTVAGVPLVLHLLAPNQRAVQVTSDLARFWQVLYPDIRRELASRYPRHAWPDDPATSTAARKGRG